MITPIQKNVPPMPQYGTESGIFAQIDKKSPDYEELASCPATVRIIRYKGAYGVHVIGGKFGMMARISSEAVQDAVRLIKAEEGDAT